MYESIIVIKSFLLPVSFNLFGKINVGLYNVNIRVSPAASSNQILCPLRGHMRQLHGLSSLKK